MNDEPYVIANTHKQVLSAVQNSNSQPQKTIVWVDSHHEVGSLVHSITTSAEYEYLNIDSDSGLRILLISVSPYSTPIVLNLINCGMNIPSNQIHDLFKSLPPKSVVILNSRRYLAVRTTQVLTQVNSVHLIKDRTDYNSDVNVVIASILIAAFVVCSVIFVLGSSGGALLSIAAFLLLIIAGINVYIESDSLSKK